VTPEPNPFFAAHNPTTLPPIPSRLPSPRPFLRMFPRQAATCSNMSPSFDMPTRFALPPLCLFLRSPHCWCHRCVLNPKCFLCLSLRSKTLYYVKPATRDACVALRPVCLDPTCPPSHGVPLCAFVCLPNLSPALLVPSAQCSVGFFLPLPGHTFSRHCVAIIGNMPPLLSYYSPVPPKARPALYQTPFVPSRLFPFSSS
jgi:hypothetical protein